MNRLIHNETVRDKSLKLSFEVKFYPNYNEVGCEMWLNVGGSWIMAGEVYALPTNVTTGSMFTLLYLRIATQVEKEYPELMEPLRNLMQKSSFKQW